MIRWEDKSRHTPRGRLADAPPPRSIDQAKADKAKRPGVNHWIGEREVGGKTEYRVFLGNKILFRSFDKAAADLEFNRITGRK